MIPMLPMLPMLWLDFNGLTGDDIYTVLTKLGNPLSLTRGNGDEALCGLSHGHAI